MTPEQQIEDGKRSTVSLTEDERWRREFRQKERANWLPLIGTVLTAVLALVGVFVQVGKKADPSVTNFWGSVYEGAISSYKLVSPSYSLPSAFSKALPQTSGQPASSAPVSEPSHAASVTPPAMTQSQPVTPIADGSCSGLNERSWAMIPGPVAAFTEANSRGYSIRLNLKNITQSAISILRGNGELTDDQGHSMNSLQSSVNSAVPGAAPTVVDADVALPATFLFNGSGNNGKTISFTVNVLTSADSGKTFTSYVLGCTNLPVHQVTNNSAGL